MIRNWIVTDQEKLDKVREYVDRMFPVVRIAILRTTPEEQPIDQGFDAASRAHQKALLRILND